MILVTGATGQLGRRIVEALLPTLSGDRVGVSVRDPSKAKALADRGVRVRQGDFADPASLAHAFEGASQVLIVSSNARARGGDPLAQHRAAIKAARNAGAARIVYTSHMAANATSAFPPMLDHAATEEMLRDAGIAWTALRNGFYASALSLMIGDAGSSGIIASPRDGKVSWTAHADLAAAAAAVLLDRNRHDGPTPPLTASEALDLEDVAAILGEVRGRPVERRVITDREQAAVMTHRGVPATTIDITLGLYRAARAGEFATVDPALAEILGRPPISVRDVLTGDSDG